MAYTEAITRRTTSAIPATKGPRIERAALAARPNSAPRLIQHKKEAFWFYRLISIAYDELLNPPHYTEDMREAALEPVDLHSRHLKVIDVGGGTGFTTLGIVEHVDPENVTILDQSPDQLKKARHKEALKGAPSWRAMPRTCRSPPIPLTATSLPAGLVTAPFDDCAFVLSHLIISLMAGFKDVKLRRIGPKWYRGVRRHGLIIGCSVTGVKRGHGDSPLQLGPKAEDVSKAVNPITFLLRFLLGTLCAAYYVIVPIYMWIKDKIVPRNMPI
ncbi:hypothetical protein HU200_054021 [Digitaria exilis]|uniref:MPBQ/MBSQ family SAM-binding methyltransferase profile domain-containing protein n=1 Tax=Digitaria exilis TaxID=1010633 RepID=A0A835ALN3_9POAL|nr:hypothetical protein HU200_054021 [Digitaria exilis]